MCEPASFVLTKTNVFWSMFSDRHEDIIAEYNLSRLDREIGLGILRCEIIPPDERWDAPLDQWQFAVDQDILPEWYDPVNDERRTRHALERWFEQKVVLSGFREVNDCQIYALGSATVEASGNAAVEASGNATVEALDDVTVNASGSATIKAWGSVTIKAWGRATVEASGSVTVDAWDNVTVKASGSVIVKASGRVTVKASGSATVTKLDSTIVVQLRDNAVLIDRSGNRPICTIADAPEM